MIEGLYKHTHQCSSTIHCTALLNDCPWPCTLWEITHSHHSKENVNIILVILQNLILITKEYVFSCL